MKTKYQTDKAELKKKIPDVTDFVKSKKLPELENKIPDVSGLATKSAPTAVENKIPVRSLVKKKIMAQKLVSLKRNLMIIIMTSTLLLQSFNTLAVDVFNARLAQANLIKNHFRW